MLTNEQMAALSMKGRTYTEISDIDGRGLHWEAVRSRIRRVKGQIEAPRPRLPASPYPRYDQPLTVEGDALILNDIEVPFHHAEFINRTLDLAEKWGINQLILGGDVMHFDTFSAWGAAWRDDAQQVDTISETTESEWRQAIQDLPPEQQAAWMERLMKLTANRDCQNDEIKAGAKALKTLAQVFENIYYVLGNHDDRFLRRLESPLTPKKLLDFIGLTAPCWHIAPYFYGVLNTAGGKWRIEHQRSASPNAAVRLADKYECNIIAAHNHSQSWLWSTSQHYYAISSGCAVDESRLPYAAQRSTQRPAHALGAVIVRGGSPFLLNMLTPWEMYARM